MTVINVFDRQLDRRTHRFCGVAHIVMRFVFGFQAVNNLDGFFNAWLSNINFLETPCQSAIFLKDIAEFLIGSRTDHADFAARQQRFDKVCRVHLTT
ncbi:hypothetical protein SRABI106_04583 [Rahnella aquatilis]|nr:hypothetical protein SRABI106_04583 [Rahnella aquatilis]